MGTEVTRLKDENRRKEDHIMSLNVAISTVEKNVQHIAACNKSLEDDI